MNTTSVGMLDIEENVIFWYEKNQEMFIWYISHSSSIVRLKYIFK